MNVASFMFSINENCEYWENRYSVIYNVTQKHVCYKLYFKMVLTQLKKCKLYPEKMCLDIVFRPRKEEIAHFKLNTFFKLLRWYGSLN